MEVDPLLQAGLAAVAFIIGTTLLVWGFGTPRNPTIIVIGGVIFLILIIANQNATPD